MNRYAYYPGCILKSYAGEYHSSLTKTASALGFELVELDEWTCCGATLLPGTSRLLAKALPLLNIFNSRKYGFDAIVAPCPACLYRFRSAQQEMTRNPELSAELRELLESTDSLDLKVYHPLQVFSTAVFDKIRIRIRKRLTGLRIACYYGCLLTNYPRIDSFDDPENPQTMDNLLRLLGAEPVEWAFKTECCGSIMSVAKPEVALERSNVILKEAKEAGAAAIALACPLCHLNLDARQRQIEETYGVRYRIPVFYFTQLLGLSLGAYPQEIGIQRLLTSPEEVLGSLGLM